MTTPRGRKPRLRPVWLSLAMLAGLLLVWHELTRLPSFDPSGKSEQELLLLEMNGEIVRGPDNEYMRNPDKARGFPSPARVWRKARALFARPFHRDGPNDQGIGWLTLLTVRRLLTGFLFAAVAAVAGGVALGLHETLRAAVDPFLQILKPISPVAWMPILLFTVKDGSWTAMLVVFLAALWPTLANTVFGVAAIRKEYWQVARLLEMGHLRRLIYVVLPGAAPAIVAGLRISFGAALVAVVPAEMLLGEPGLGNFIWLAWNNLDLAGVLVGLGMIGLMGLLLDAALERLAARVSYEE